MDIEATACRSAVIAASRRLRTRTRESCAKSSAAILASQATVETTRLIVEACARSPDARAPRLHVSGGGHPSAYFSNPLAAISDLLSKSMATSEPLTLRRGARVLCHAVGGKLSGLDGLDIYPSEVVATLERLEDARRARFTSA